ncbi:phytanoyl-CoA dioxygenase family protein [Myxococcota bacterium]|nr:phytanoyl-CoA dioxygenase family protein [Myxococcota bacterium]
MLLGDALDMVLDAPLSDFAQNGYARLGRVLAPDAARRLGERSDALMLGEIKYPGLFYQHDSPTGRYEDLVFGEGWVGPSLSYRKIEKLELDPLFSSWIENDLFARIARSVLGSHVTLYRAVLWNKAPESGMDLPWHQDDGAFWGIDRAPCLQIWTALDDAPSDAGCVEVVPRSHLRGLASPLGGTVCTDQLEVPESCADRVLLPVVAGEALLIHNHVWHRSGKNHTRFARRAIGISYLSGDTRCRRKRCAPREFRRLFGD